LPPGRRATAGELWAEACRELGRELGAEGWRGDVESVRVQAVVVAALAENGSDDDEEAATGSRLGEELGGFG